jgi:hypothetical protein
MEAKMNKHETTGNCFLYGYDGELDVWKFDPAKMILFSGQNPHVFILNPEPGKPVDL